MIQQAGTAAAILDTDDVARFVGLNDDQAARFEAFCLRVEEGDNLKTALAEAGIAWGQVCRWVDRSKDAEARYARARSISGDWWAAKATEAAEDAKDKDAVPAARLKFDARRWRAAVANPKRYGEKVDHTTDGKPLPAPQIVVIAGRSIQF